MTGNILFLIALGSIWIMLLYHMFLMLGGYLYAEQMEELGTQPLGERDVWPKVSVLIPAHNEEVVLADTLHAMLRLDYPVDRLEIIVVNDFSSDRTGEILNAFAGKYPHIKPIHLVPPDAAKGKSNALNRGLAIAEGEYIVVYDADNTPQRSALKHLVTAIDGHASIGAAVGKFRVVNAYKNLLTRFINIETISFQWMAQAGRWRWFGISTIPGTNFIIRKSLLDKLGGWDVKALAEDTELSIRVYEEGYQIRFYPLAITWEQEPETWRTWLKQRTRWARGNQYVIFKYLPNVLLLRKKRVIFDLVYFFFTYFMFLGGVVLSHVLFFLNLFGWVTITLPGPFMLIWVLAYILFVVEILVTLAIEKTELTFKNFCVVLFMYMSYSQLWLLLVVRSILLHVKAFFAKTGEVKWEKTQRFEQ